MKKIFLTILLLTSSITFADQTIFDLDNTGLFGCYVESMPFWQFWNRGKIYSILAEETQTDTTTIEYCVDTHFPILITCNRKEAEKLQNMVAAYGCDLEIKEMTYSVDDEEYARQLTLQGEILKLGAQLDKALASNVEFKQ